MLVIYDDVFVPWERVFMCGEVESLPHALSSSGKANASLNEGPCKAGFGDLILGASKFLAESNGLDRAPYHRRLRQDHCSE